MAALAGGRIPAGLTLALTVAPPAVLAAWRPLYRSALVTSLIVLTAGAHAAASVAWLRVAALGTGAIIAVVVVVLFRPRSAHGQAKALAGRIRRRSLRCLTLPAMAWKRHFQRKCYKRILNPYGNSLL